MQRDPKLRKNGDGRGYAVAPGDTSKTRQYFGQHGTPECDRLYRNWLASLRATDRLPSPDTPKPQAVKLVAQLIVEYLSQVRQRYSDNEYKGVYLALERLATRIGGRDASAIEVPQIRSLIEIMCHEQFSYGSGEHAKKRHYSRTYVNKTLARIKRFVRWSHMMGYVTAEQWSRISVLDGIKQSEKLARETIKKRDVPLEFVKQTLPHLTPTVAAMVRVQYLCGMRPQDVYNIRWIDIDTSGDVWIYVPFEHKNTHRGLELMKAIPKPAQTLLEAFRPEDDRSFIFSPKRAMAVFWGTSDADRLKRFGYQYVGSAYYHAVRDACDKAKIDRWSPNQLRHTMATHLRSKYGQEAAQYYLGHANISTTDIYAHRAAESLQRVAKEMVDPFGD